MSPNRDRLHEALRRARAADSDVLVDLRGASFFDSTALAELIMLYKRLTGAGRRLEALVGDSNMRRLARVDQPRRALRRLGAAREVPMRASREAATRVVERRTGFRNDTRTRSIVSTVR